MSKLSLIDNEKKQLQYFLSSSLLLIVSGITIWLMNGSGFISQLMLIVHVIAGIAWTIIFTYYTGIHFKRTIGSRKVALNISGLSLALIGLAIIYTGFFMLFDGFAEQYSQLHLVFSLLLLGLSLAHIAQNRLGLRSNRKAKQNLPLILPSYLFKAGMLTFLLSAITLVPLMWLDSTGEYLYQGVKDYTYPYGESPFAPSNTQTPDMQFVKQHTVAGSDNCQQCHADIYQQWQSSIHRYAAADPSYVRNVNLLESKKGIAATRYCEGCHAPVAMLTGNLTPGGKHGGVEGTAAFNEGVSCRSCHSIDNIINTEGVASYHFTPSSKYLLDFTENTAFESLNNLLINTLPQDHMTAFAAPVTHISEYCSSCHSQFMDERLNHWGWVKMQDEYSAWLDSPFSGHKDKTYSNQEITRCQDCHMPLVASDDPSADAQGKIRSHQFFAANTFVAQHFNETEQLQGTIDFLQQNKMRISIDEPRRKDAPESRLTVEQQLKAHQQTPYFVYLGEQITLNILVSNIGVGHDFPGGTVDLNESWLHIEALDAQGQQVFVSGDINENGFVDPKAHFYKATPINRQGKEVWKHDLFNMTGESYRSVIKSGQTDRVEYQLNIPAWAKSPITVYATLKYRKLNKKYSDWVMQGKSYTKTPVIDVARTSLQIPVLMEPPVYTTPAEN